MPDPRDTPAMRQYYRFKREYAGCVLLFRIGDFYEMFDDDAVAVSKAIGLTLTQRTEGVPMAGVPFHQLDVYLRRLLDAGFRVAVAEQLQDVKEAKAAGGPGAVIDRGVTHVLTPGTLVDDSLLSDDEACTLASVCFLESGDEPAARVAVAVAELSTGDFTVVECAADSLVDELARRSVSEVLFAETADGKRPPRIARVLEALGIAGTPIPSWHFRMDEARQALHDQYGVSTLAGFGISDDDPVVTAAGALVRYLQQTQTPGQQGGTQPGADPAPTRRSRRLPSLKHLRPPKRESVAGACMVDATTLRSLEILRTIRSSRDSVAAGAGESDPGAGPARAGLLDGSLVGVFVSRVGHGGGGGSGGAGGCCTAMGKRLLREWLCRPCADLAVIGARHAAVALLVEDRRTAGSIREAMDGVQDIARIAGRLSLGRLTPRDLVALGRSLARIEAMAAATDHAPALARLQEVMVSVSETLAPLAARILAACVDAPPTHLREGGLVRDGVDAELDEARLLRSDAGAWLANYQKKLLTDHNLTGLKVGYNRVTGYFIELSKTQARTAPAAFTRRQTLANAERFITPELKDFEDKVTSAEARAIERELAIFNELCDGAAFLVRDISYFADAVAELDVLACFADKAVRRRWVRPDMRDEPVLEIVQGRHPVLDELLGTNFVPNDAMLGSGNSGGGSGAGGDAAGPDSNPSSRDESQKSTHRKKDAIAGAAASEPATAAPGSDSLSLRGLASQSATLALITGPNMAGKSTFIRQTALIVLLAHAGSFVPAEHAVIGLTDRIFTRIGADDALHAGQSTFMVEMTETARILHHATARSLVILDEIGRGTSTLDGLSLAWAIAEQLASAVGCRTLFATHYHELTELEDRHPDRIRNLHVTVREWGDQIIFLHRILPGRTDQSYGIHVAKLAGIPEMTIRRAREVLDSLAVQHNIAHPDGSAPSDRNGHGPRSGTGVGKQGTSGSRGGQMMLFTEYIAHPAVNQLREIKLEALSPMEAFDILRKLKEMTKQ